MAHICGTRDQAHRLYFNAGGKPTALETMLFENGMLGYYAGVRMGSEMARRSVEGLVATRELVHSGIGVDMLQLTNPYNFNNFIPGARRNIAEWQEPIRATSGFVELVQHEPKADCPVDGVDEHAERPHPEVDEHRS